jgi:rhodanese-related sulfurtransferase
VYCYHGNSSRDMADMIARLGFSNVSHLIGGWDAWANFQMRSSSTQPVFNDGFVEAFA